MKDDVSLVLSGLAFIVILSPILTVFAFLLAVQVVVVNPLSHVYRIIRYGIQYEPHELV